MVLLGLLWGLFVLFARWALNAPRSTCFTLNFLLDITFLWGIMTVCWSVGLSVGRHNPWFPTSREVLSSIAIQSYIVARCVSVPLSHLEQLLGVLVGRFVVCGGRGGRRGCLLLLLSQLKKHVQPKIRHVKYRQNTWSWKSKKLHKTRQVQIKHVGLLAQSSCPMSWNRRSGPPPKKIRNSKAKHVGL